MRLPCKDQVTNRETHPDDPSQAPDPVARVKSEPDSEGRDESPVTENCEDVPDQTNSEDFEREEGEPLAEIFKDPLTAMAEQGRLVRVGLKSKCGKSSKCKQMPYKNSSNCTRGPKSPKLG